jgi:hypothetical protein
MGKDTSGSLSDNTTEQLRSYVEPSRFAVLAKGGPAHNCFVETIVYKGGEQFQDPHTGELVPYKLLTFDQLSKEEREKINANRGAV